jgi:tRNA threonylcarbamoyladenosine biosynthesis protein TsaB
MSIFLIVQALYQTYEVGLFSDTTCIDSFIDDKKYASRDLIPTINAILKHNHYTLQDIAALGVNQGPGPFTSLRVIITTANGLAFATGIPLIGINSLEALLKENENSQWPITVALLNAFNNDLYYAIESSQGLEIGCENGMTLLARLKDRFPEQTVRFLGGGVALVNNEIMELFGSKAYIQEPLVEHCSLQQLALMTEAAYKKKESFQTQLLPLYLKNLSYKTQI